MPTLVTHWALGHIGWAVAIPFAVELLPAGVPGGRLAHRLHGPSVRRAFEWFLVAFGLFFTAYRLTII